MATLAYMCDKLPLESATRAYHGNTNSTGPPDPASHKGGPWVVSILGTMAEKEVGKVIVRGSSYEIVTAIVDRSKRPQQLG